MKLDLTPKTRAVARYLVGGWNPESIQHQMGMTQGAVKAHCHRIIAAVGVHSVTAAAIAILRDAEALTHVMEVR